MSIDYKYKIDQDVLLVVASGNDDSLEEVGNYARNILITALQNECTRVCCDERNLQYTLSAYDTYELAKAASKEAKPLKRIAIVCDPKYLNNGKFYETVAQNRGLTVLMTDDYDHAIKWLGKED